jgi:hypothetical protein
MQSIYNGQLSPLQVKLPGILDVLINAITYICDKLLSESICLTYHIN